MKIGKIILKMGAKYLIGHLEKQKDDVVKFLNKRINIPMIDEKLEAEYIEGIFDLFLSAIVHFGVEEAVEGKKKKK